jgi:glycosyltransferase involved in cell wall biosynthesis
VEVSWVDYPDPESGRAWRRAAATADRLDLVHVHYEYGLFRTVKPYRNRYATFLGRLRPPVVVTLHGPLPDLVPRWSSGRLTLADLLRDLAYLPFFSRWSKILQRGIRHWIVHSQTLCNQTAIVTGEAECTYIPHPVPVVGRRWTLGRQREKVVVTPGFVKPHKGYGKLAQVLASDPSWSWIIAGGAQDQRDLEYLHRFRKVVAHSGLEDRVQITGYLDRAKMEATICGAALAVFPYDEVAGSGALAWTIGCGIPVATTDLPEFRSLRSAGAGIELLPAGGSDRWLAALDLLWRDSARLDELALRNRSYAATRGLDACAMAHAEIYARVASEAGS